MCGIVGLLLKDPKLRPRLGKLMVPMMIGMTERGPDSAGLAVFTEPLAERLSKLSVYAGEHATDWSQLVSELQRSIAGQHSVRATANHAVLTTTADPQAIERWLDANAPHLTVLSIGRAIDLYKDIGAPADVAKRYDFANVTGTHVVGHTRMATESAVTPAHATTYAE